MPRPTARMNPLRGQSLGLTSQSLSMCAWNSWVIWLPLGTGKTDFAGHVVCINRTRVQWFLNSLETLCLLAGVICLCLHFIQCIFPSLGLSHPRFVVHISWPPDSSLQGGDIGHFLLWSLPRLALWEGCLNAYQEVGRTLNFGSHSSLDGVLKERRKGENSFFSCYILAATFLSTNLYTC